MEYDAETIQASLGKNIRNTRELINITRENLAERTNYSFQNIAKIENGQRFVTAGSLARLCNALDISPAELFDINSENKDSNNNRLIHLINKLSNKKQDLVYDIAKAIDKSHDD